MPLLVWYVADSQRDLVCHLYISILSLPKNFSYILPLMASALLICFANYHQVYNKLVQLNENFLLLLVLVGGTGVFKEQARSIATYATIAVGSVAFCGVIIANKILQTCCINTERYFIANEQNRVQREIPNNHAQFWDSIFDETEPLLYYATG